ncbi:hypothetical protein BVRB_4g094770 [Beta vulgaris subsp. vulgaris]|nr:hypothetical protein BVRB_4g094770 [Beta vulgaris subsp. vulgaris]
MPSVSPHSGAKQTRFPPTFDLPSGILLNIFLGVTNRRK